MRANANDLPVAVDMPGFESRALLLSPLGLRRLR